MPSVQTCEGSYSLLLLAVSLKFLYLLTYYRLEFDLGEALRIKLNFYYHYHHGLGCLASSDSKLISVP
jgi:hypothetical protein